MSDGFSTLLGAFDEEPMVIHAMQRRGFVEKTGKILDWFDFGNSNGKQFLQQRRSQLQFPGKASVDRAYRLREISGVNVIIDAWLPVVTASLIRSSFEGPAALDSGFTNSCAFCNRFNTKSWS